MSDKPLYMEMGTDRCCCHTCKEACAGCPTRIAHEEMMFGIPEQVEEPDEGDCYELEEVCSWMYYW